MNAHSNSDVAANSAKTLLLVDGSSYLYRAFHALPDLRNRNNEPTGALYGVLNMLRRLHKDYKADYSACIFDAKGKTFRDDWYPQYKANRPPMPQDLVAQIEPLHEAIRAMGWPLLMIDGVEADDVIGTLSVEATKKGMHTIVSTGDKDMAQLVDKHVTLVNTMSNEILDEAGVAAKFGVPPGLIIDYLTLIGDTVDNVPGVEKVGPKTALKWLGQYGSLDQIVQHAGEMGGVVGENLRKALDWLPQARRLLTIRSDLDLGIHFDSLLPKSPDKEMLREIYSRYEFKNWLKEVDNAAVVPQRTEPAQGQLALSEPQRQNLTVEIILSMAELEKWLAKIDHAEFTAISIAARDYAEPLNAQLVGISFAVDETAAAYLPLAHAYAGAPEQISFEQALTRLRPFLESSAKRKIGFDLKFALHVFANHSIALSGLGEDVMLASYVVESHQPHDLPSQAARHLSSRIGAYAEIAGKGAGEISIDQVEIDQAASHFAQQAATIVQLNEKLREQMDEKLLAVYRDIEMPALRVLYAMERNGVLIDSKKLALQSHELGEKMLEIEAKAYEIALQPFNLNSPKQIQEILFERLGLPVLKKTPSGTPSTDEEVLQQLALDYPLPKLLLQYRSLAKLKSTYTDKLPKMVNQRSKRVHTSYSQAVAVTGRLASTSPNLQNIPVRSEEGRKIREAFIAPSGHRLISADYSQIELRIMAHISADEGLLSAFSRNEDIHRRTAAEIFGVSPEEVSGEQRRCAKVINFGLIYGMSAFGLAGELGVARNAAQAYIDRYFARYPGVAQYMQRTREEAKKNGYVETVFGRRLWLPEINSSNGMRRAGAERAAINAPMQGTAADLIKLAMIAVQNWLDAGKHKTILIMQVHDELVLEVPEDEIDAVSSELPKLMANVANLSVPLLVECGTGLNWEEAH